MVQEVRVSGRITYKNVLGEKNPADLLTKYMPAELMGLHLATINAQPTCGRAESAPTIDTMEFDDGVKSWVQGWHEKKVRFDEVVSIRPIPAIGRGRFCRKLHKTKWSGKDVSADDCEEVIAVVEKEHTCCIGERGRWVDWSDEGRVPGLPEPSAEAASPSPEAPNERSTRWASSARSGRSSSMGMLVRAMLKTMCMCAHSSCRIAMRASANIAMWLVGPGMRSTGRLKPLF